MIEHVYRQVEKARQKLVGGHVVVTSRLADFSGHFQPLELDVLALDDDVGMPGRMMISPRMWREFFPPRLAEVIRRRPGAGADELFEAILVEAFQHLEEGRFRDDVTLVVVKRTG